MISESAEQRVTEPDGVVVAIGLEFTVMLTADEESIQPVKLVTTTL